MKTLNLRQLFKNYRDFQDVGVVEIDGQAFAYENKGGNEFDAWQLDEDFQVVNECTIRRNTKVLSYNECKEEIAPIEMKVLKKDNSILEMPNGKTYSHIDDNYICEYWEIV